jgi:hypothetical protein
MTGPARRDSRSWLSWRTLRWVLAAAAVPGALWACNSHPLEHPQPAPEQQTDLLYEVNPLRQLDLVFLVDNSSSMTQEQNNLRTNFPNFMTELEKIPGGLPDTRIAVVSSNFGAGPTVPSPECNVLGDRGKFQVKTGCGLDTNNGYWLATGGGQQPNFTGSLANVFSCMAELGTGGCGYEHQLQSLRAALAGSTAMGCNGCPPENRGFLRDQAYLGVVILSDEDDCSGEPGAEFFRDLVPGQAGSLRCALLGHTCNGQPVPATLGFTAPLSSCEPYVRTAASEVNSRLINVTDFVDFLRGMKNGRVDKILVSSVIGWPLMGDTDYKIIERPASSGTGTELDLGAACSDPATGNAAPGIRLRKFTQAFPNNTIHSICQASLAQAMTEIGKKLAGILTNTCVTQRLLDTDPMKDGVQADCQVVDRVPRDDSPTGYRDNPLPPCTAGGMPCWELAPDPTCGSGYKTVVQRGGTTAEPNTLQSIRCLTCADGSVDPRCVQAP